MSSPTDSVEGTHSEVEPETASNSNLAVVYCSPDTSDGAPAHAVKVQLTDQTNLLPFRQIITVYIALSFCVIVTTLDSVIVATSLSTISNTFHAGAVISWVPSAYLLTSTAFQPLYGRFSDIFGRKSAMCLAMGLYMIGNAIAGFSKSIIMLVVFRGLAGAGGGGIIGMTQIIISDIITLRERGKYQGVIGGMVALGYAIGPILGGVLTQKVSWRWSFWTTLPLSLLSTAIIILVLPLKPVEGNMRQKLVVVDYLGAILTLMGCTLIMLPLIWGGVTFPWTSSITLSLLCSGVVVGIIFGLWEWKGAKLPILPMYIFKQSTVSGVYIAMFVNGFVFFSSLYYMPQFFQASLGYTPIHAGLFLMPLLLGQTVTSWISGVVVSRTGRYRTIVYTGFAFIAISCGLVSTFTHRTSKGTMIALMLLAGCGSGMTLATTTVAVQASVQRKDMSVVTAFRSFFRMLGGALSLAVASSVVNNSLQSSMISLSLEPSTISDVIKDPTHLARGIDISLSNDEALYILEHGYEAGFGKFFIINGCLGVVATIIAVTLIKHKELARDDDDQLKAEAKATSKKSTEMGTQASVNLEKDIEQSTVDGPTLHDEKKLTLRIE